MRTEQEKSTKLQEGQRGAAAAGQGAVRGGEVQQQLKQEE